MTPTLRQPVLWVLLAVTAVYIVVVLSLAAYFEGGCQESYPARCPVLNLAPEPLIVTLFFLVVIAVVSAIAAGRSKSVARAALLMALAVGTIAIIVVGFGLSLTPAWETRY
ncbi:hypothetical protein [Plantibacter flavus]|uniref:hypothetical protein n=1 Tax=Plantibacter flavus TaxID=150123 RepID=UPI003396E8EF